MAKWSYERERERERERVGQELLCFTPGWDKYLQSRVSLRFFHGRLIQDKLLNPGATTSPAGTQNNVTYLLSLLFFLTDSGVEKSRHYIFYDAHIFPSGAPPTQFMLHFHCLLFTWTHICISCFWNLY